MTDLLPAELPLEAPVLPDPRPSDPLEALSWLGETEEEVVRSLRERGIKGNRESGGAFKCVIANYLSIWWDSPAVSAFRFNAGGGTYNTPLLIGRFIFNWDDYQYPDLIAD